VIKTLVNDTFPFNVVVAIGGKLRAAREAYGKEIDHVFSEDLLNDEGGLGNFTAIESSGVCMMWLRYKPKDPESIATLAHEACHVAAYVMRRMGIEDEECGAFITDWLVRRVLAGR
jgi:hypothetical protein